jgi:hypothetical protein
MVARWRSGVSRGMLPDKEGPYMLYEEYERLVFMREHTGPILGQEAICPDGLGRVADFDDNTIRVATYIGDRQCCWDKKNVQLVPIC